MNKKAVWLSGDLRSRKLVLDKLKNQFAGHDIIRYDNDISFAYLEQQVFSSQCFSEKRLIILDGMPIPAGTKQTMIKHFGKMVENLPDDLILVFNNIPEPTLLKAVSPCCEIFETKEIVEKDSAVLYVQKTFGEFDKVINQADAEALVESNGFDSNANGYSIDILWLAVSKIISYLGQRKNVTKDDVLINVLPSEQFIIWHIQEALDSKSFERCQNMLFELISYQEGSTTPVSDAIHLMFNMVANRYKMLIFLKEGLTKGLSQSDVSAQINELVKLKSTGTNFQMKLHKDISAEGTEKKLFSEKSVSYALDGLYGNKPLVDLYSRKELFRIYSTIQDCMVELRYRYDPNELIMLADVLFLAVCTPLDDDSIAKIRKSHYVF